MAGRRSMKTIYKISGCKKTHMVGTSPANSKQPGRFSLRKTWSRSIAVLFCHPRTFIDLAKTALVGNHMHGLRELEYQYGCHRSDEIQKIRTSFFGKTCWRIFRSLFAIRALLLTLQKMPWLVNKP